jgi:hypothetical protein
MADTFELEAEYLYPEVGSFAYLRLDDDQAIRILIVAVRRDPDDGCIVLTAHVEAIDNSIVDFRLAPDDVVEVVMRASYSA